MKKEMFDCCLLKPQEESLSERRWSRQARNTKLEQHQINRNENEKKKKMKKSIENIGKNEVNDDKKSSLKTQKKFPFNQKQMGKREKERERADGGWYLQVMTCGNGQIYWEGKWCETQCQSCERRRGGRRKRKELLMKLFVTRKGINRLSRILLQGGGIRHRLWLLH